MRFNRFAVAAVRLTLGLIVLAAATAWSQTPNTTTNITLQNLLAEHGAVTSGQVCATPSDAYGNPIAVSATGWGMILPNSPLCANVVNGAIVGSLPVPDANHTSAASPIFYNIALQWSTPEGPQFAKFKAVAGVTGTSWALDGYTPPVINVPAVPSQALGYGSSIPSSCTSPSLYTTTSGSIYSCANGVYTPSGALITTATSLGYGAHVPSSCIAPAIFMTPAGLNYNCVNGFYVNSAPAVGSYGTMIGASADGLTAADDGGAERFFADFHPVGTNPDGSQMAPGWDTQQNVYMRQGHWNCANCTSQGVMVRALTGLAGTGPYISSLAAQGTLQAGGAANCMYFTNAASGTVSTSAAQRVGICIVGGGWEAIANGTITPLTGLSCSVCDVSFWYYNSLMYFSAVAAGPTTRSTQAVTFGPLAVTLPSGILNFEVDSASAADEQSNVRYAIGNTALNILLMPYDGSHVGLSAEPTSLTAGTTWVVIPKGYKPGMPNRAVLYFHGYGEVGWNISGGGNFGVETVAGYLAEAGYVVIGMNNTFQNCYGSPQCMADVANVWNEWSTKLSLVPQPYLMADSMGGFEELNSVALGVVHPRAMVGMCINTNLAWDFYSNYVLPGQTAPATGAGSAYGVIQPAFGFTLDSQYPAVTAGYDPVLNTGVALANLAQVPTMLWSSYADTTVYRAYNSDYYASYVNNAGGNVAVITSTGNHEDLSNFNGPAVVAFFNAH